MNMEKWTHWRPESLKFHLSRLQDIGNVTFRQEKVWQRVLSNSTVGMLLTKDANSVLRHKLVRPRKSLFECLVIEILRAWRKAEPPSLLEISLGVAAFLSLLANFLPSPSFWPWLCYILVEIKTNIAKCASHKHKILCLFTHLLGQGAST